MVRWRRDRVSSRSRLVMALIACVVLLPAAFAGSAGSTTSATEFKIGLLVPLSGANAAIGQSGVQWASVMKDRLTAKGGPLAGKKVKFIIYDTKTDPATAASFARRLVTRDRVIAISCCASSSEALQVMAVASQFKIPVVGGAILGVLTNPETPGYGWYFRLTPSEDDTVNFNIDFAKKQGWKELGISHSTLAYGADGRKKLSDAADAAGLKVVATAPIAPDATDATGAANRLASAKPDAVLTWDYATTTAVAIRDLRNAGYKGKILSNWSAHNPVLWALAGKGVKDVYAHSIWDPFKPYTLAALRQFARRYGTTPSGFQNNLESTNTHVIAIAIANALKTKSNPSGDDVRKGLLAIKNYPASKLTFYQTGSSLTFGRPFVSPSSQNPYQGASRSSMYMEETNGNGGWKRVR